jgi:hypothetical protein
MSESEWLASSRLTVVDQDSCKPLQGITASANTRLLFLYNPSRSANGRQISPCRLVYPYASRPTSTFGNDPITNADGLR